MTGAKIVKLRKGKNDSQEPRGMVCVNMLARLKQEHAITHDLKKLHRIRDSAISLWRDLMSFNVEVTDHGNMVGAYTVNKDGKKVLCFLLVLYTAEQWAKLVKANDAIVKIETLKSMEEKKNAAANDTGIPSADPTTGR